VIVHTKLRTITLDWTVKVKRGSARAT